MGGPSRDSLHLSGVGFVTFIGTYEEELLNCPWAGGGWRVAGVRQNPVSLEGLPIRK